MLKIIQVGVGGYGGSWLPTIMEDAVVEHAAIVDMNPEHLSKARQTIGLGEDRCFTDLEEAIAAVEADALLCVVPPAHHETVICTGIDAGLHVLSEKPIADTVESARRILAKVNGSDRIFMIAQKARFHPWVRKFREIVTSGELGRMSHITHYFRAPYYAWGEFRHKMDHPLYIEMSIHHFDLLRALLGCDPLSVWAQSWNTPYSTFNGDITGIAHFTMDNGLPVSYHADAISSGDMTDWFGEIRAVGETGTLTMVYPQLYIGRKGANHTDREAPREELMQVSPPQDGQAAVLREFAASVADGRQPESAGGDNLKSLAMVFGAVDSSRDQQVRQIADYL